jgi:hypothetical protein
MGPPKDKFALNNKKTNGHEFMSFWMYVTYVIIAKNVISFFWNQKVKF